MILFNRTRIQIDDDEVTSRRMNGFIIMYATPAKGLLESWLIAIREIKNDDGVVIGYNDFGKYLPKSFSDLEFTGVNILEELHKKYIAELQVLNPNVTFITQIIKPV